MELQFRKNTVSYLGQALREVQNQEQTQEVKLTDGMPDIGRVLAAWGQVIARSKEWRGDSVSFTGGVMVWVLYAPEDGTEPRVLESWIPFQMKWELPRESRDGVLRIGCLLRFVDARTVSARKIMVRCGVSVLAEAMVKTEAETYSAEEVPAGVELLRSTYPIRLLREAGEKEFLIDEELTLPDSCPLPEKLICCTMHPEVTEQKVLADKVVFRGNGNLHILYRSEDGQLCVWDFELPFSQLAELDGDYSADSSADVSIGVTSLEPEIDDEGHLRLKCGLVGQYVVDDRQMLELVEDAYSPGRELVITRRALELPAVLENRNENIYAEQTIQQEANVIVDCTFLADQPRARRTAAGIELELPGHFQVLYYDENGTLQSSSARWEGQWSMGAGEDSRVDVTALPLRAPQAMAGSGTVTMQGTVRLGLNTMAEKGMDMVTGLEVGEERQPDPGRPSLILRKAGSLRLWDIAKSCGSTMEAIAEANDLNGEPDGDQILLIPVS